MKETLDELTVFVMTMIVLKFILEAIRRTEKVYNMKCRCIGENAKSTMSYIDCLTTILGEDAVLRQL